MSTDTINFSVLIPDGETHILTEVVYSLSLIPKIKLYVMSNKKNITLRYSRYIHHFSFYPKTTEEQWISNINMELTNHKIDVVMPIYEHGIRTLSKFNRLLSYPEKLVSLPELKWFDTANDKGLLAHHLGDHSIPSPYTVAFDKIKPEEYQTLIFPLLVKKVGGVGGGRDVHLFRNEKDMGHFFYKKPIDEYVLQEYIHGYDIDCSVLCDKGKLLAYTIQKGTLFGRNKFVPQLGLEFLFENEILDIVVQLVKSLKWSGVAHIDLRYDTLDQKFKVIEVNPRFWATVDASTMAGVNFPYLLCLHTLQRRIELPTYKHIKYLSLRGLLKRVSRLEIRKFNITFLWRYTPLGFAIKDPVPTFLNLIRNFRKV